MDEFRLHATRKTIDMAAQVICYWLIPEHITVTDFEHLMVNAVRNHCNLRFGKLVKDESGIVCIELTVSAESKSEADKATKVSSERFWFRECRYSELEAFEFVMPENMSLVSMLDFVSYLRVLGKHNELILKSNLILHRKQQVR